MERREITVKKVEQLKKAAASSASGLFLWDTKIEGLGLRASPEGKRAQKLSWIVRRYLNGDREQVTIGHYPTMDIGAAREEARTRLLDTSKPLDAHDQERAQAHKSEKEAERLGESIEKYLAKKEQPNSRYWYEVRQMLERDLRDELGCETLVKNITSEQLEKIIEGKRPGMARFLYAVIRPFLEWCILKKVLIVSPLANVEVPPAPEARDRRLDEAEIRAFWEATAGSADATEADNTIFNPFHRLLLLTAQRREEVGGLRWSELDLENALWTIPKERTKNGKAHLVHLSPQALQIIATVPRIEGRDFLFSTTGATSISGYSKAKARLDSRLSIPAWRVHDLRRTARTGFAKLKVPKEVAEKIINHVPKNKLEAIYNLFDYLDERKLAMDSWVGT